MVIKYLGQSEDVTSEVYLEVREVETLPIMEITFDIDTQSITDYSVVSENLGVSLEYCRKFLEEREAEVIEEVLVELDKRGFEFC